MRNNSAVIASASGPSFSGPNAASNSAGENRRTFPSPRRSQYRSSRVRLPVSWQRNRRCSRLGGSATRTSPVIRGSSTIASSESSRSDDALADAADLANRAANDAAAKMIDPRRDRDRLAAARRALDVRDAPADDAEHAAPHRFNFRKFGHSNHSQSIGRTWTVVGYDESRQAANSTNSACPSDGELAVALDSEAFRSRQSTQGVFIT